MKKQLRSFGHAFEGIYNAIRTEAHLRFHLVAGFYVCLFAYLGEFSLTNWAVLVLTIGAVISAELINTAIEDLCDLYSTSKDSRIKRIKDISAAAVLVVALSATAVAVLLFILTGSLHTAFTKLISQPLWFIPLGISAVLSVIFTAFCGKKKHNNIEK